MSSALVTGNFGLYAARHTLMKTTTSNGPGTPFYIYSLQLQLSANNGTPMDGTVRVYAPASTEPLPDGTVAYIVAKVHISPDVGGAMLEPIYFFPYPGLPDDDGYEAAIPDMLGTTFTALGTVVQNGPRTFLLKVSEFVRGGMQTSMVGFVFDESPRWQRTKPPRVGGSVFVVGTCSHVLQQRLHVSVSHLVFGAQVTALEGTDDDAGSACLGNQSPSSFKSRKYGPPRTDVASAALSQAAGIGAPSTTQVAGPSSANTGPVASGSAVDPLATAPFVFAPSETVVTRAASAGHADEQTPVSSLQIDNASPAAEASSAKGGKGKKRKV